ncbi:uncharacterized protein [Aquarana catesbeiana]|uniref:uncharacterized protein n=3 Tax=Aquarana catesbeiana TaxID=8400 RepID=UPI003CC92472
MFEDYGGAEGEGELGEGTFKRASRSGRDSRRSWKVQGAGQCHTMSDLEGLMSQLREEAAVRGAEWLQETISAAIRAPSAPASEGERGSHRARRSRPPERFSPDRVTNSQRHPGNMVQNVQGGPPAKRSAGRERVSGRAAPTGQERIPAGGRTGDRPNSGRRAGSASPAPRKTAVSSAIAANATPAVVPGPSSTSAGDRQDRGRNRTGLLPTRAEAGRTAVAHTGPGKAVRKSTGGFAARRKERMAGSAAAAVNVPGGPVSDAEEDAGRSEGEEMSGSEEETAQLHRRMGPGESRRSADGATPMQPVGQVQRVGAGSGATGGALSRLAVGDCTGVVEGWIKRSVSGATWAAYNRVWQEWMSFGRALREELVGQGVRSLLLYYLARKFNEGASVSVISIQLAGLAFLFKLQGQPDFTKDFWVRQALKGYRRAAVQRDSRRPVTFEILGGIVEQLRGVCSSDYEVSLFKVAFVLAFFGAFRIGELVSPSKTVQGGVGCKEVTLEEDGVSIFLRKSKTDQEGRGRMVRVYSILGSPQCPVGAVREFLKVRPDCQGPLLIHANGDMLSRFQFIAVFRKCLLGLGLEEREFSSHSFRIGAATEAARLGMEVETIKRIGRWESNRFQSYVRPQLAVRL